MSSSEQEQFHRTIKDQAYGNAVGQKLTYDPLTKTIKIVGADDPDHSKQDLVPTDLGHSVI